MGDILVNKLHELQALPEDLHLFCPRCASDPGGCYLDEDLYGQLDDEDETDRRRRLRKLEQANARKALVLECLPIFAFDGSDAAGYKAWLEERLNSAMTSCDVCIRLYYRARSELQHKLEEDYDLEKIATFMEGLDNRNIERIKVGLDHAAEALRSAPPESRGITCLDSQGMYALFETLSCEALLKNEALLAKHFDEPFNLVQSKKRLRVGNYTPAMTRFLFSQNEDRYFWAASSWTRFKRPLTKPEFAAAVRDPLFDAMKRVQLTCLDADFLPLFWAGVRIIMDKLEKELITHSLRAIDIDVCKLALEHLQFNFSGFKHLIGTVQQLLEKSAIDFWDAMGAISPVTVIEQILNNRTLDQILLCAGKQDASESALDEVFGWVTPFFASIKPSNQTPACRSLVHQLFTRFQNDKYSRTSRSYCYQLGLRVLLQTLRKLNEGNTRSNFVGYATVSDMIDFVGIHIEDILATVRVSGSLQQPSEVVELGTGVVQYTLSLDCLSLDVDRETLLRNEQLQHDLNPNISPVWDMVIKAITPGDIQLATKALIGGGLLVGTEKFITKAGMQMSKGMNWWNNTFYSFSKAVSSMLERLADFAPTDLDKLFDFPESAHAVVIHLFSSESDPRQAAVEVLKAVSCQDSRRDAFGHLMRSFYWNALKPVDQSLRRIAKRRVFAPAPAMLKLCSDIVDALCNTQDGILRSRTLNPEEAEVTERVWSSLWQALITIFDKTEDWSNTGHDKSRMMDFCRDTMQFADTLYDQYSHFASAINQSKGQYSQDDEQSQADTGKQLLKYPQITMNGMVKWLRLRDDYLVSKSVALTSKLLVRLRDANLEITDDTRLFIEEIINGKIRAKLSMQQQAELERALETHLGYSIKKEGKVSKKAKQGTLNFWATSGTGKASSLASSDADDSDSLNKVLADSSKAADAWKARQMALQVKTKKAPEKAKADVSEFRRQRELEKEAMKREKQAALAKLKKNLPLMGVAAQTAEAGSGTRGIGVTGKDHSVKGEGVMVSSEESEEDEDDEIDAELFGLSVRKEAKSARAKLPLLPQAPVKKRKVVRSFKDMRARLAPDLSSLHKMILGWDYFHEGHFPPNSRTDIYTAVPNKFQTPYDYQNTFQPLLTLEAWQGFVKAREEGSFKTYEVKVINRANVDAFIEVSTNMSHAESKEISISEGDVCLLSKAPRPAEARDAPHCLARVHRITRKKAHLEVLYRIIHGTGLVPSLVPNATVFGVKVQSITPLEREYGALLGLQYYDLCDEIIKAKPSPLLKYSDKQLEELSAIYNLNKAQTKAVKSAVDNDAFTLIQGPPGSGKTKTIVAIVGALLTDILRHGGGTVINKPQPAAMTPVQARNLPAPKKLLVCAPSNAAVDELVMRFKEGIKTTNGQNRKISVVRLGRSDAMNVNVKDVTLDELVNARLNINPTHMGDQREETGKLMQEHKAVSEQLRKVREELDSAKGEQASTLKGQFDVLRNRKTQLSAQIDSAKDNESTMNRQVDLNRKRAQQSILDEAHVICATLSGSGHDMFQNLNIEFETVVVDEAAQCVEMSALIPLKYGCAKAILVGDPKQLPPTVFSKEAARFQYEQSLFVRMQKNHPDDVHLLDTQYRMHPEISWFPSQTFYDGRLLDGDDMAGLRDRPWHSSMLLGPYRFFDVHGQQQAAPRGHSLINLAEIDIAMELYNRLRSDFSDYDFRGKIGIITPYKSQLKELKVRFAKRYTQSIFETIEFNTTDAYQGRESEIIIFSCVRAHPNSGIGFLQDIRRMNVGLTRAKSSLWVLGNSPSLVKGEFWKLLVEDAKARDRYTQGNLMKILQRPSSAFPAPKGAFAGPVKNGIPRAIKEEAVKREPRSMSITMSEDSDVRMKSEDDSDRSAQRPKKEKVGKRKRSVAENEWDDFFDGGEPKDEADDVDMKDESDDSRLKGSESTTPAPGIKVESSRQSSETSEARPGSGAGGAGGAGMGAGGQQRPRMVPAKRKKADPFMPRTNKKARP